MEELTTIMITSFTINSWLNTNNDGIITIHSHNESFTSPNYTSDYYLSNVYTRVDLYMKTVNGIGTLSDNNMTLTITIPNAPKTLLIKTNGIEKIITFHDSLYTQSHELVYAPTIRINYGGSYNIQPAFIYFNIDPETPTLAPYFKARLLQNGKVIGFALGKNFKYARNSTGSLIWGLGGIVYHHVWMLENPTPGSIIDFTFPINGRTLSFPITFTGHTSPYFTTPPSEVFNVQSSHQFQL